jgi:hypothetical protein
MGFEKISPKLGYYNHLIYRMPPGLGIQRKKYNASEVSKALHYHFSKDKKNYTISLTYTFKFPVFPALF